MNDKNKTSWQKIAGSTAAGTAIGIICGRTLQTVSTIVRCTVPYVGTVAVTGMAVGAALGAISNETGNGGIVPDPIDHFL